MHVADSGVGAPAAARHGLESLYHPVAGQGYVVLLTDARGVTVDFLGDLQMEPHLRRAGLYLGAYQITLTTWRGILFGNGGVPPSILPIQGQSLFDAVMQDRIAVALLERRGALPLLRQGKLQEAVAKLLTEWTSLPGAKENAHRKTADGKPMDMAYLQTLFVTYLNEEMRKEGL